MAVRLGAATVELAAVVATVKSDRGRRERGGLSGYGMS